MSRRVNAIALTAIMIASLFAGGTVAASEIAQQTESTAPTEITACTVIDSPGHYALTQDIVRPEGDEGPCIEIRASDVTLEGNGHVIDGNDSDMDSDTVGIATTAANPVRNVTVANVTVREFSRNIQFEAVTDGQLTNVASLDPAHRSVEVRESDRVEIRDSDLEGMGLSSALSVSNSENLSVVNNTLSEGEEGIRAGGMNQSEISDNVVQRSRVGISLGSGSSGNVISNNSIEDVDRAISVSGSNNTLIGNSASGDDRGIVVRGSNHTVANNDAGALWWAVSVYGVDHTFRNNDFSGGEIYGGEGGSIQLRGSGHVIENNSLGGYYGVYVESATGPITLRNNRLTAVRQVEVEATALCPDPGVVITAHGNVFELGYEPYSEQRYGIVNHDDDMVNATNNYWGASDGPSSHDGENVTDPVTGEPANGSGMPVSEGVHFDPHLEEPPANETDS